MLSATSLPLAISKTWLLRALGVSLVITMGGFGLFFDPGGRPRGRRPLLPGSVASWLPGFWSSAVASPRLSSSSAVWAFGFVLLLLLLVGVVVFVLSMNSCSRRRFNPA